METELADLKADISGTLIKTAELEKLIRYLERHGISEEYDEDIAITFVDRIIIHSRSSAEFILKCGLKLRERL